MFYINGIQWNIVFVNNSSDKLRRSNGSITVGMADWNDKCVYMSNKLHGTYLRRVLAHELCHCFVFSYGVVMDIEEEERLANWISLYGTELVYLLDDLMQNLKRNVV